MSAEPCPRALTAMQSFIVRARHFRDSSLGRLAMPITFSPLIKQACLVHHRHKLTIPTPHTFIPLASISLTLGGNTI